MSAGPLAISARQVVLPDRLLAGGVVRCAEGRITEIRAGSDEDVEPDLHGAWLLPGFIDLHWHGYGGHQLGEAVGARAASQAVAATGVTTCYAGLGAGHCLAAVRDSVAAAATVVDTVTGGARLAGLFLEGPYISVEKRGAWIAQDLRLPSVGELQELVRAGRGGLKRINVAPELPGAVEFIHVACDLGLAVSVGHSNATYDQALAAIDAGATIANHTFNTMSGLQQREPGLVGAVLSSGGLLAELILDGVHVHPATARSLLAARGATGMALITDGSALTGLPAGLYQRGDRTLRVAGAACRLPDGTLAGSVSGFDRDVRNARAWLTGDPLQLAAMSSGSAATAMGIDAEVGFLRRGLRADLVLLDDDWTVLATLVAGEPVYRREARASV